jgi:hypothetical protein
MKHKRLSTIQGTKDLSKEPLKSAKWQVVVRCNTWDIVELSSDSLNIGWPAPMEAVLLLSSMSNDTNVSPLTIKNNTI